MKFYGKANRCVVSFRGHEELSLNSPPTPTTSALIHQSEEIRSERHSEAKCAVKLSSSSCVVVVGAARRLYEPSGWENVSAS